jgi:hypothetical protein
VGASEMSINSGFLYKVLVKEPSLVIKRGGG